MKPFKLRAKLLSALFYYIANSIFEINFLYKMKFLALKCGYFDKEIYLHLMLILIFTSKIYSPLSFLVLIFKKITPLHIILTPCMVFQSVLSSIGSHKCIDDQKECPEKDQNFILIAAIIFEAIVGVCSHFHSQIIVSEDINEKSFIFGLIQSFGMIVSIFIYNLTYILKLNFNKNNCILIINYSGVFFYLLSFIFGIFSGFFERAQGEKSEKSPRVLKLIVFSFIFLSGFDIFIAENIQILLDIIKQDFSVEPIDSSLNFFHLITMVLGLYGLIVAFPNTSRLNYKLLIYLCSILGIIVYVICIVFKAKDKIYGTYIFYFFYFALTMPSIIFGFVYKKYKEQAALNYGFLSSFIHGVLLFLYSTILYFIKDRKELEYIVYGVSIGFLFGAIIFTGLGIKNEVVDEESLSPSPFIIEENSRIIN